MIVSPAIMFKPFFYDNSFIISGKTHKDCVDLAFEYGIEYESVANGFITDNNRFMDEYEAYYEAVRCGQILHKGLEGRNKLEEGDLKIRA